MKLSLTPEQENAELKAQLATLRKPLLDWYHNWTDPSHPCEPMTLYKAIEQVYGVDVTKREVPKE